MLVTHMHKTYGPLTRHDTAQKSAQVHTRNIDIGEGRRRGERERERVSKLRVVQGKGTCTLTLAI